MASSRYLLERCSTVRTGEAEVIQGKGSFTIEVSGNTTAATGAADVDVLVSNRLTGPWKVAGNFVLALTTDPNDSVGVLTITANWPYCAARVNSISGTGAEVSVTAGWR